MPFVRRADQAHRGGMTIITPWQACSSSAGQASRRHRHRCGNCIAPIFGSIEDRGGRTAVGYDRMARKPTGLPSLAAVMVEDATKAFVRDDAALLSGAVLSEALLRHYRAATRAAVAAAPRRFAKHSGAIFDDGCIHIEQLAAEIEGPRGLPQDWGS